jgi:hypothetical protein
MIGWEVVDWIHLAEGRGPVASSCEHSNEPLFSIKNREFLDYLSNCCHLKKDFTP